MLRRGYVHHGLRTVFFWAQKSACTTLFNTLTKNFGETNKHYHRSSLPWKECLNIISSENYRSVAIVRNPADRIISAYVNKLVTHKDEFLKTLDDLTDAARKLHEEFCLLERKKIDRNVMTFEDFLRTVEHLHKSRKNPNRNTVNGHWDTQAPPRMQTIGFRADRIIRVENFQEEFGKLCEELGMEYKGSHRNKTQQNDTGIKLAYIGNIPADELSAYNLSKSAFLNAENARKIHDLYKCDYEIFGYAKPQVPQTSI